MFNCSCLSDRTVAWDINKNWVFQWLPCFSIRLNKLPNVAYSACGMTGSGCRAGHSGSHIAVAPFTESPGAGSAPSVPSGRSQHPLSKFSTACFSGREALPLGRRTSRCHRRASRSAARPWTAWGCYGSGKH